MNDPLTNLFRKGNKFRWTKECQIVFDRVKEMLSTEPVLNTPYFNKSFELAADASNIDIGAILLQRDNQERLHPVSYFTRKLSTSESLFDYRKGGSGFN